MASRVVVAFALVHADILAVGISHLGGPSPLCSTAHGAEQLLQRLGILHDDRIGVVEQPAVVPHELHVPLERVPALERLTWQQSLAHSYVDSNKETSSSYAVELRLEPRPDSAEVHRMLDDSQVVRAAVKLRVHRSSEQFLPVNR
jgi:hypothetical protein